MNFCITGGCGFVGSAVCALLLKQGHSVHVLDNNSAPSAQFKALSNNITLHAGDIRDAAFVHKALMYIKPDVCIHLAAMHFIPACNAHPELAHAINVDGTNNILAACASAAVNKVILISSGAIYADSSVALNEESSAIAPVDIYGSTKLAVEQLGRQYANNAAIPEIICVRLFNVYGPGETNPHVIPEIISQLKNGNVLKLGNIQPKRDFIYTEDVAEALYLLAVKSPSNPFAVFNLCSGTAFSVEEIIKEIALITGREIKIETDQAKWRKADKLCQLGDPTLLHTHTGFTCNNTLHMGLQKLLAFEQLI